MSNETGALEAAFADACGGARPVLGGAGDVEQLDMLRDADGKLPADAFRQMRIAQRGRGRPANARNKRNADLAKLICSQHGDPQTFLGSVYGMPLDQLVELILIAEGVPEREDRLMRLCDTMGEMVGRAVAENWAEGRLKALTKGLEAIERAASSLKSKPGEIALKALGHQITAAKEVSPYVHSKKPIEATVTHKTDGVIFMPAPQSSAADPIDAVMRRTVEAMNRGDIDPARITDMRFDGETGAFVVEGGDDEGEVDE